MGSQTATGSGATEDQQTTNQFKPAVNKQEEQDSKPATATTVAGSVCEKHPHLASSGSGIPYCKNAARRLTY